MLKILLQFILVTVICLHFGLIGCRCGYNSLYGKGIFVRIVNIDTVRTSYYLINGKKFHGLRPNDTTKYKLMKVFDWSAGIVVFVDTNMYRYSISDCRTCRVDTPKYITLQIRVLNRIDSPQIDFMW
jgi:hypothetical protein